jgi:predicted SprT family Zn-dependent metalloprotease
VRTRPARPRQMDPNPEGCPTMPATVVDNRYLKALAQLWAEPRVRRLRLRSNPRLTATVARCVANADLIQLSPFAASASNRLRREILCHEAAHYVVLCRYGAAARPHGAEWAALVKRAGFQSKASLVRCGARRRRARVIASYHHFCPVCHFVRRAKRRMTRWRCPECRAVGLEGTLRIESVSASR